MSSRLLHFAPLLLALAASDAQTPLPPHERVVLVELFTSEGCSSCPPADALLKKLNGRVESGTLIVGLSEHVTYWNNLGWTDPFSAAAYTERQSRYSDRFHLESVYTPQAIVNGETQVLGSDAGAILRAVRAQSGIQSGIRSGSPAAPPPLTLRVVSAVAQGPNLAVTYTIAGGGTPAELYAVVADDMATSHVLRGENGGQTLSHVAIARSLTRVAASVHDGTATVLLPAPPEGLPEHGTTGHHLILFAQSAGLHKVLAVESKPL